MVITKNLTLLGGFDDTSLSSRTPRSSIIDGSGAGVVISITNSAVVTVEGFTVTGGNGTTNEGHGGGIFVETASATIVDNLIEANVASSDAAVSGYGGGIYAITGTVMISGNTIQSNKAYSAMTGSAAGVGGGVVVRSATEATLVNNDILSNTAAYLTASSTSAQGFGGGIDGSGDTLVVEGNTIKNNLAISAGSFGAGGGVEIFGTLAVTLTNNLIVENRVMITGTGNAFGGGVSAGGFDGVGRRLILTGNQIMSNTTMVNGDGPNIGVNGGVNLFGTDDTSADFILLQNNDIVGNVALANAVPAGSAADGGVTGAGVVIDDIATAQIINNNIRNNIAVVGSNGTWNGKTEGGIYISEVDMALVTNNNISGNSSDGAGIKIDESVVTSTNNIVVNNSRGGLRTWSPDSSPATVRVINDTYYNNNEVGIDAIGGGTTIFVTNTIISGHQHGFLRSVSNGSKLFSNYNLLNNTDNYEDATPGTNDILNQDPQFVDAANNDFHLTATSPAVDRGTPTGAPSLDFEGDSRPQALKVDLGADESSFQTVDAVTVSTAGGTLQENEAGLNGSVDVNLAVPASAVNQDTVLLFTNQAGSANSTSGFSLGGLVFTLEAFVNNTPQPNFTFNTPATLTFTYSDADVAGLPGDEADLNLRYWDGNAWSTDGITKVSHDLAANTITFQITHLTEFALLGPGATYLPLVIR